jgi:TrpR-related protein YerC/YecD
MNNNEQQLYQAFLALRDENECKAFLKDLCTPKEIKDMQDRLQVAKMLIKGEYSYRQINQMIGVSLATITRVARFLIHEHYQGYKTIIARLNK